MSKKSEDDKKKKKRDSWLEEEVFRIMYKSLEAVLKKSMDDIFKGW